MTDTRLTEHVELIESHVLEREGSDHHVVEVTLIRAGTSKMGNHYPPETLTSAVPLFEGAPAFADHQKRPDLPEGSVRDIVGHYQNVRAVTEGAGISLRAELHLLPTAGWLFHLLRAAESNPRICGLSIDAWAHADPARSTKESQYIAAFSRVNSVDIVTRPSAGGGVQRVLQSDPPSTADGGPPSSAAGASPATSSSQRASHSDVERSSPIVSTETQTQEAAAIATPTPAGAGSESSPTTACTTVTEAASTQNSEPTTHDSSLIGELKRLQQEREAAQRELQALREAISPAGRQPANSATDLAALAAELRRERDVARAESILAAMLQEAALPEPVAAKLRRQFEGRTFDVAVLESAIGEEKSVLAALTTSGEIRGMGFEKSFQVGMSEYEQLQAAFDALFEIYESDSARSVPKLSGIREAFYAATGRDISSLGGADYKLRESVAAGLRNYISRGRLTESETLLREADVTTASFSALLGTSMNKRLLKDYQAWPSEWQKFCSIVAVKDFKQQTRVRLGAFGSLSTVAEDAAYTTLTLADTSATYTPAKRGNLVQVTRETIINDDLYAIKQIPQKLAVAAAFTLAEFVYGLLAPNGGNIYDSHPLFDSVNHLNTGVTSGNLGSANSGSALSSSALQTAIIAMRKQKNLASKPIGLKPRYLLVPPDLEFSAMTILRSAGLPGGNNNDINPMMGYAEPIVSPQLPTIGATSTTIWIMVADPRVIDTIEVGFIGGQANPVLLIQDMPLYGLNFTQDTISYKVRHEYGGAVVDYRGFYMGNN
jgi:phage major head subunit gpT-like protein